MSDWISTKSELPDKGRCVLFYVPDEDEVYTGVYGQRGFYDPSLVRDGYAVEQVSHWQPCPEKPEPEIEGLAVCTCGGRARFSYHQIKTGNDSEYQYRLTCMRCAAQTPLFPDRWGAADVWECMQEASGRNDV